MNFMRLFLVIVLIAFPRTAPIPPDDAIASIGSEIAALPAAVSLPDGASTDWWSAVQADLSQREYEVSWQAQTQLPEGQPAYQAPNRAHNLRAYFTPSGLQLYPRKAEESDAETVVAETAVAEEAGWQLSLSLSAWGRAGRLQSVAERSPETQGNQVTYAYAGGLEEWYVNDASGLEQGYTLQSAPPGDGPLVLELAAGGDLRPSLARDGSAVEWSAPDGAKVLRYAGLHAWDAGGRDLAARLGLVEKPAGWCITLTVDDTGAAYPLTIDPLISSPAWTAEGEQAGAHFGESVSSAGDVNGDGYNDVIVGAPYHNITIYGDQGRVYLYYGSAAGLAYEPAWTAEGDQTGANFGESVSSAGDVNDDGYSDVIVGAYNYNDNSTGGEGRVYVYYGSVVGFASTADWIAEVNQAAAEFGGSVSSAGDVNGDGYSDVIIGASGYNNDQGGGGRVFVYHGSAAGLAATPAWTADGDQIAAYFGESVSGAGDVNDDGYDDVIIGAFNPFTRNEGDECRAYVYYGSPTGLASAPVWTVKSDQFYGSFGGSVSGAGDVNGDGYGDVIIGAYSYNNGQREEGRAYVYYGSAAGLASDPAWTAESDQVGAYFGGAVSSAGDINNDGYSDVIVGAYLYDNNGLWDEGRTYVYYGSTAGLHATPAWMAESDMAFSEFGGSVSGAGDVNGDGYSDVIVGASVYDNNGEEGEGRAYVYYGSDTGLASTAAWAAESDQAGANFGESVSSAGDVNGDGYSDVIVGAYHYDNGEVDEGRAYVYYGSTTGLDVTQAWTAEGDQVGAHFGWSVSNIGDVNGDGYSDVIVGADCYDHGQTDEGRAYIYYGSDAGLSRTAAWTAESDQAGAVFGASVSSAWDVNSDGYSDIIIGAPAYDNGEDDEGRAYVYYGSTNGLVNIPAWVDEGDQVGASFGGSVSSAGDVNGDGYSDVIIGAMRYNNGVTGEGRAYVYYGSTDGLVNTPAWMDEGDQVDAAFGESVSSAGDVNGDGYNDVIVGAHGWSNAQMYEGCTYVYYGSAAGLASVPAWTVESDQDYQDYTYFGRSVSSAGDVNGDGFSDMIVGAPAYDNGEEDEGRVYVYYGADTGLANKPAWTAESDQDYAYFGRSVSSAGDVNGDGYSDIIVGAYNYNVDGSTQAGRAFVYYGSAAGISSDPVWMAEGNRGGAHFGRSVSSAGDVNDDGYSDVIVSTGSISYVYHGSAAGLATAPAWTVEGALNDSLGRSVSSAGDVNGDGYGDVIIGAYSYNNGQRDEGRAYVYYGSAVGLTSEPAWGTVGQYSNSFGSAVSSAGDVNGDGYSDVIIGAYSNGDEFYPSGRAYVYYGSAVGLTNEPTWVAEGHQDYAKFGESVSSAGDVNGDGYSDVIVGATNDDNGTDNKGRAYVYYGSATGLASDPAWTAEGEQVGGLFGGSVSSAGDVNGDGYSDVIIGAYSYDLYDPNGYGDEGRAYVYYGSADGLVNTPAWMDEGDQVNAAFGKSVSSAGDVNGDGYNDLIIGAPDYYNAELFVGRAYVYYGNQSAGLSVRPRQKRAYGSLPLAALGRAADLTICIDGYNPFGRTLARLEWQVAPVGTPFGAVSGVISGISAAPRVADGEALCEAVTGLNRETAFHWRVRLRYSPVNSVQPASRWFTLAANGANETDLRISHNQAPSSNAGSDRLVVTNAVVTLNGNASWDLNGNTPLAYLWTQISGPGVVLSSSTTASPTFVAPGDPSTLVFSLTVMNSLGLASTEDTVQITVVNQAPISNAGSDQSVRTKAVVTLNSSASMDPDGNTPLTYRWTQTSGPGVSLSSNTTASPTFVAPGDPATLIFSLTITDSLGLASTEDKVQITITNRVPTSNAGPDQAVSTNAVVTLNGGASMDPDGHIPLRYRWTQTSGPGVVLNSSTSALPTFVAPGDPATLVFSLTVTNSLGIASAADTVLINVENQAPVLDSIGDQGGARGKPLTFTVSAFDLEGDPLIFSLDPGAPVGAAIDPTSGDFTWMPNTSGIFVLTVRVSDGRSPAGDDFETITITIKDLSPFMENTIFLPFIVR